MAVLSPSEDLTVRLLSGRGIVINSKTLRKIVRDVGQIGLSNRGVISVDQKQAGPSDPGDRHRWRTHQGESTEQVEQLFPCQ